MPDLRSGGTMRHIKRAIFTAIATAALLIIPAVAAFAGTATLYHS